MASSIDAAFPVEGNPTTLSVRTNFSHAKDEIEALQSGAASEASTRASADTSLSASITSAVAAEATLRTSADASLQSQITALGTPVHETKGTWTPVLIAATLGNWTVTYTTQLGFWHRIGDRIFFDCIIVASAVTHTSATGQIQVTGLPVAAKNTTSRNSVHALEWDGLTFTAGFCGIGRIQPNTQFLQFILSNNANGGRALVTTDHTTGNPLVIMCSGSYEV